MQVTIESCFKRIVRVSFPQAFPNEFTDNGDAVSISSDASVMDKAAMDMDRMEELMRKAAQRDEDSDKAAQRDEDSDKAAQRDEGSDKAAQRDEGSDKAAQRDEGSDKAAQRDEGSEDLFSSQDFPPQESQAEWNNNTLSEANLTFVAHAETVHDECAESEGSFDQDNSPMMIPSQPSQSCQSSEPSQTLQTKLSRALAVLADGDQQETCMPVVESESLLAEVEHIHDDNKLRRRLRSWKPAKPASAKETPPASAKEKAQEVPRDQEKETPPASAKETPPASAKETPPASAKEKAQEVPRDQEKEKERVKRKESRHTAVVSQSTLPLVCQACEICSFAARR